MPMAPGWDHLWPNPLDFNYPKARMTVGSKITDNTHLENTFDWAYPPIVYFDRGNFPVGMLWQKSWSGGDYPVTPPVSIFGQYWRKVEVASSLPGGKPRLTYRQVWEERRNKPRRKFQVEHPYTCTLSMWSDSLYTYKIRNQFPPPKYSGDSARTFRQIYGEGYTSTNPWTANDTIALQGKLREKIVGSDFDMSVFLGEGREALAMIGNAAVRVRKALSAVRRGNVIGAANHLLVQNAPKTKKLAIGKRSVAENWLELQYGWLPLLQDAHGAACALAQQLNEPAVQTYRVRLRKRKTCTVNSATITKGGDWFYFGETRAQLIAKLTEVNVPALNGLADPSTLVWELLPYSFVADWFIPIGSYLSARGLANAVTGTFVTTLTVREMFECNALLPGGLYEMFIQPNYRSTNLTVNRTVSTSLQTPRPEFKTLDKVVSWKRAANAVALLVTGFSGGKR